MIALSGLRQFNRFLASGLWEMNESAGSGESGGIPASSVVSPTGIAP